MKEFFGINITENKQNETLDCLPFLAQQTPAAQSSALESRIKELENLGKKAQLPPVFQILYMVMLLGSVSVGAGMIRGIGNVGLAQAYANAGWLFYLAGAMALLLVLMIVWKRRRTSKTTSGEAYQSADRKAKAALQSCYAALGVPSNAPAADVMGCKYKITHGKVKLVPNGYAQYLNPELRIFTGDGCLYLADAQNKYAIPLTEIKSLRKINKSVSLHSWNKEDHFDFGRYADYKIRANDYGNVTVKPYYALEVQHGGEEYTLHFPCYELPIFQRFLNLPVSE